MRFFPVLLLPLFLLGACSNNLPETCHMKPESGKCRAALTRWYLDDRSNTCKPFIWGGCDGVVPFDSLESCHAQCMAGQPMPDVSPSIKNPPVKATPITPADAASTQP